MTVSRRDKDDSPFGDWIRHHAGLDSIRERLSITDSDYWIHRYRAHSDKNGERAVDQIMLVELKTNMRDVPFAQRDTLVLVNQLLRRASKRPDGRRSHVLLKGIISGETRRVRCFGVHLLQLGSTRPDNSAGSILWDHRYLTEEMLVEVLRFDRDPDSPMRRMDLRRHHANGSAVNLTLFKDSVAQMTPRVAARRT